MKKINLIHNIAALGSVQVINLLLPLITLPYITRTLGAASWGEVALAQSIIAYFTLVTNWGFAWSATKKIAATRDNRDTLSKIFFPTWMAQWCIGIFAVSVLMAMVKWVEFFEDQKSLYYVGIGLIFSNILFPIWLMVGLEKIKEVAFIQVCIRIASLPFIFALVSTSEDAVILMAINSIVGISSGIFMLIWIKRNVDLKWEMPKARSILNELRDGASIFGSTLSISLYTMVTPTILGIMMGPTAVGYYTLADRARMVAQAVISPISQAMYPRMSHLFAHHPAEAFQMLKSSWPIILSVSATCSLLLWFLAKPIILILAGQDFLLAVDILKWLAPLPLIIAISNFLGTQIMLPNNMEMPFNRILGIAGVISLCAISPFIIWKGAEGASINTLVIEIFVTVAMAIYLKKIGFYKKFTK